MTKYITVLFVLLAGCATDNSNPYLDGIYSHSAGNTTESSLPVKCKDKADCDSKWSRAQVWVASNGKWKIQTMSDSIIQTYGPDNGIDAAFIVTKRTNADGSAEIDIKASCANWVGCSPSARSLEAKFRNDLQ